MSQEQPRIINAYAAKSSGRIVEPFQYEAPPLGNDDVEIKISYCGICGTDLHTITSGCASTFPCVAGHEIVGVVTQAGPDVEHLSFDMFLLKTS